MDHSLIFKVHIPIGGLNLVYVDHLWVSESASDPIQSNQHSQKFPNKLTRVLLLFGLNIPEGSKAFMLSFSELAWEYPAFTNHKGNGACEKEQVWT